MSLVGILVSLCLLYGVQGQGPRSLTCLTCPMVDHVSDCTIYSKCHQDEVCGTEVHYMNGNTVYAVGCQKFPDCVHWHPLHHTHFPHKTLVDYNCCDYRGCNIDVFEPPTTPVPTTISTSAVPVSTTVTATAHQPVSSSSGPQIYDPVCFDKEEDGVSCASLDLFSVCTDTSTFGYVLSHQKCARHCGLCTPTVMATKAPAKVHSSNTCEDYEQDGIKCMFFDLYGFCTDPSMLTYVISHTKCKKHCGLCTSGK